MDGNDTGRNRVPANRIDARIGALDQAAKDAENTARIFSSFHRQLIDAGVDGETAGKLTVIYAEMLLKKG